MKMRRRERFARIIRALPTLLLAVFSYQIGQSEAVHSHICFHLVETAFLDRSHCSGGEPFSVVKIIYRRPD